MLYYSERTRTLGNVDKGNTVTDFLPAEIDRGITIQSAAISFQWPPPSLSRDIKSPGPERDVQVGNRLLSDSIHNINLIDTPGHADFTFEVRRSLRVLDGAICILDGVAGVEAQTEQVWAQAGDWRIPRLIFVNKLDRDGASFSRAVKAVGVRLAGWPAVCQIPWFRSVRGGIELIGVGDVVRLQGFLYEKGGDGKEMRSVPLQDLYRQEPDMASELQKARAALIELLAGHDEALVETLINEDEMDHLAVPPRVVFDSLRRCLLNEKPVIPIFAGSSLKNIGIQPLLNAVVDLLPNPEERPDPEISVHGAVGSLRRLLNGNLSSTAAKSQEVIQKPQVQKTKMSIADVSPHAVLGCALAFKVVLDPKKGMLVYIRVYSGSIEERTNLYNTNLHESEKAQNLFKMYGSKMEPISSISAGDIGVIVGLKSARTGDTLVSFLGKKDRPPEVLSTLQLRPIEIPPPLFYQSIEPSSLADEKGMRTALNILLREDPSLAVTQDDDTGQTLLSGMGDLHLEIARDRLIKDLKTNASLGKIEIGYRESINKSSGEITRKFEKEIAGKSGKASCTAEVIPFEAAVEDWPEPETVDTFFRRMKHESNVITITAPTLDIKGKDSDTDGVSSDLRLTDIFRASANGAIAALTRGPRYAYPVGNVHVKLTFNPKIHSFGDSSTMAAFTSASKMAVKDALKLAATKGSSLLEPVMDARIIVDENSLGAVSQDLQSQRGGTVYSLGDDHADDLDKHELKIDASKIYVPPDPFAAGQPGDDDAGGGKRMSFIKARVPLKEMVGYLKHLRSMTGGRGAFIMKVDRFEKVSGHREKALVTQLGF